MNEEQICMAFSRGDFAAAYSSFSEDICWKIIGDQEIWGKEAVMEHCRKMQESIGSAVLTNTTVISGTGGLTVAGYCSYADACRTCRVDYCDLYRFEQGSLKEITSYCISS